MRAGIGFDAHAFAPGRPLVLGGVEIPGEPGLHGHSDADVLSHAIADALLGAAGLGDLGVVFGVDDPRLRDASSLEMVRVVAGMLAGEHLGIQNVDAVVICERPRIAPHRGAMGAALAAALGIEQGLISVKATSTDRMGFTGRGEGVAAMVIALVGPSF
ncbi:MAG: 2-C-methyl-D-erythritol 2,4-cyclodiphosphate synthase [Actinomycetota bacterium]